MNAKQKQKRDQQQDMTARQPPFDLQAEMGVLGSIVLLPRMFAEVDPILKPEDFYDEGHGRIFRAMKAILGSGRPLDPTLLIAELRAAGDYDAVGGSAYLSKVINAVPNAAHCVYYAEIVASKASIRQVIVECTELLTTAYDGQVEAAELMARADESIAKLTSRSSSLAHIVTIADAADELIKSLENEDVVNSVNRAMFGIPTVDEALGPIMPGETCIVAARPSMGKTAFAQGVLRHSALRDRAALLVSLEMTAGEIAGRELSRGTDIDSRIIRRGDVSDREIARLRQAQQGMVGVPFYTWAPASATLQQIRSTVLQAVHKLKVKVVAVDYIGLTSQPDKSKDSRRDHLAEVSRGLKRLAKECGIPIFVLCQLNREAEGERPNKAMLRECGAIEEDADCILFLHQESKDATDRRLLIVDKFRGGGKGDLELKWDGPRTEFSDLQASDNPNYDAALASYSGGF